MAEHRAFRRVSPFFLAARESSKIWRTLNPLLTSRTGMHRCGALRWFYREATRPISKRNFTDHEDRGPAHGEYYVEPTAKTNEIEQRHSLRPMEPRPAASDLGQSDWEKPLINTMRRRGLLWRAEETYRKWAAQFARFIAPKRPTRSARKSSLDGLGAGR